MTLIIPIPPKTKIMGSVVDNIKFKLFLLLGNNITATSEKQI
jgi:hypothetical protein